MRVAPALVAIAAVLSFFPAPAAEASSSAVDVARAHVGDVGPLEVVGDATLPGTDVHVVRLRRTFDDRPAVTGGSYVVGVRDGRVEYAKADPLPGDDALHGEERLLADDAWRRAAAAVGRTVAADAIRGRGHANGFATLAVRGFDATQQVRRVAFPTRSRGVRRAWEANVVDLAPSTFAATVVVDAETGAILRRDDRVDAAADQPNWRYFASHPPLSGSDDRRTIGCFPAGAAPSAPCAFDVRTSNAATPGPWDRIGSANPSATTTGNNADTALGSMSPLTPGPGRGVRPTSSTRDYLPPWTDAWRTSKCNPSNFSGGIVPSTGPNTFGGTNVNDVNAAIISLFANHNRMHDWSYELGFTEDNYNFQQDNFGRRPEGDGDPMLGEAQEESTASTYAGRNAANQVTLQDGIAPTQSMFLWRPIAGAYYAPCADGDFDASIVAHEYAHGIVNRMAAGPDASLTSSADGQARAIGEGFADAIAVEYLHEHGLAAPDPGEDPFAVGAYVSGAPDTGIRNHSMADSPLGFADVRGYDGMGQGSPHDDGEIWAAVNHDIRQALVARHEAEFPSSDAALQLDCARGRVLVTSCPGNRRWIQIVFTSLLLLEADATMLDARDAMVEADRLEFGRAHRQELWTAFARRGLGENASTSGTEDGQPTPSFESPERADESRVVLRPRPAEAGAPPLVAQLFVGDYEAGATPVADTDPATPLGDAVRMVPGDYDFVVRAAGFGLHRTARSIPASSEVVVDDALAVNRASTAAGATISGDGAQHGALADDTEATTWQVVGRDAGVAGASVTVDLAGGLQTVERVNVSAMLQGSDDWAPGDASSGQNRFTALRAFTLEACTASAANEECRGGAGFTRFYASAPDAFPGGRPRPVAPDLNLRSFDVPDTTATHVRLVVAANQCTGNPTFGDNALDEDPRTNTDCRLGDAGGIPRQDRTVRAAELQVFSRLIPVAAGPGEATRPPVATPGSPPRPAPRAVDPAPSITSLGLSSRRFRLGRRLPRAAQATGTTLRFSLSEPAAVTLTFTRALRGRRVGRRCLPATPARRRRRACRRTVVAGTLRIAGRQGINRLAFQGRLTSRRRLSPGAYTLTAVATDRAGQRSRPRALTFTLLPARRR